MADMLFPLVVIIFISRLIHPTNSDPRIGTLNKKCGSNHAKNISTFNQNYLKLMQSMQVNMQKNKFARGQKGRWPNRAYLLAQCLDDLSATECQICFAKLNSQVPGCFPATSAIVYLEGCYVRVENYSFYKEYSSADDIQRCSDDHDRSEQFAKTAKTVVHELVKKAPGNKGYADGHATSDGLSVYGMAKCWQNLDDKKCAACLRLALKDALDCLPGVEGRALKVGCFLRFSDYDFLNRHHPLSNTGAIFLYVACVLGAAGICSSAIFIGCFVGTAIYNRRINRHDEQKGSAMESFLVKRSLQFKYSMLEKATENFIEAHKIGQGGFGEVFKGTLPDGREIAIKRLYISGKLRNQEICNEVDIIGRAQHKNLVRYLGCCFTKEDSLLVYEYLPNKSLDLILFDQEKKKDLDWKKRFGIIKGTAEGLEYLHKDCQVRIVHRDIKASNILLDSRHRPKISDFGLARFYSTDQLAVTAPYIAGTLGYMAPEYLAEGRLTDKVDVYSYGVLVLEIVSGMQNNNFQSEDSLSTLVTSTWKHFQENTVSKIVDTSINSDEDTDDILRVVQIGLLCTQELPSLRPTMASIIQMLNEKESELPTPTKPPFTIESTSCSSRFSLSSSQGGSSRRQRLTSVDSCEYYDSADFQNMRL